MYPSPGSCEVRVARGQRRKWWTTLSFTTVPDTGMENQTGRINLRDGGKIAACTVGRRNLQGLQMSKPRQKASKTKLKTMNQISAAEAWKLFHAAWGLDATGHYRLRPEYFPENIALEDFFKVSALCRLLLRIQRAEGADTSTLTEKGLDKHFSGAPQQRKIVDFIRRNKNRKMSLKEIAVELGGVTPKTVQNLLTKIFKKTNAKNLTELRQKLPPLST
jgi:DNA-binding CsgD family transcriptional regulator